MREQTYCNQAVKGRAVAPGGRGHLIAMFDVIFGLSLHFDATAWKLTLYLTHTHTSSHTHFVTHRLMKNY